MSWPFKFATLNDAPASSKYIRFLQGFAFWTSSGHVDSAHDDGSTVIYGSYLVRNFSVRGQADFYSRSSNANYVSHVDVCCFFTADTTNAYINKVALNTKELPMYARSEDVICFGRYKPRRVVIGVTDIVPGYSDVVCDTVSFDLRTRKNVLFNPNTAAVLFIVVYTNKTYLSGAENFISKMVDFDIRYDIN